MYILSNLCLLKETAGLRKCNAMSNTTAVNCKYLYIIAGNTNFWALWLCSVGTYMFGWVINLEYDIEISNVKIEI